MNPNFVWFGKAISLAINLLLIVLTNKVIHLRNKGVQQFQQENNGVNINKHKKNSSSDLYECVLIWNRLWGFHLCGFHLCPSFLGQDNNGWSNCNHLISIKERMEELQSLFSWQVKCSNDITSAYDHLFCCWSKKIHKHTKFTAWIHWEKEKLIG